MLSPELEKRVQEETVKIRLENKRKGWWKNAVASETRETGEGTSIETNKEGTAES